MNNEICMWCLSQAKSERKRSAFHTLLKFVTSKSKYFHPKGFILKLTWRHSVIDHKYHKILNEIRDVFCSMTVKQTIRKSPDTPDKSGEICFGLVKYFNFFLINM